MDQKTIVALVTPPGTAGIAVLRLSGVRAVDIAKKVFVSAKDITEAPSHTLHYGRIKNHETNEIIDEVLLSIMLAPRSYTGENTVEISCHGSYISVQEIINSLIHAGASSAAPGEFTKRAFLNGRIDLSQAEAVLDIIGAKSNSAHQVAVGQLGGTLSEAINAIRDMLVGVQAFVQAETDFPEEGLAAATDDAVLEMLQQAEKHLDALYSSAKTGQIIKEGIKTVIAGRPNVGKSSLLNALLGQQRAIVTEVAGTTRDTIEEYVNLDGIALRLVDTAGIRETQDVVEQIGVTLSYQNLQDADLVLFVADLGEMATDQDKQILQQIPDEKLILVLNKSDKQLSGAKESYLACKPQVRHVVASMVQGEGLLQIKDAVKQMYNTDQIAAGSSVMITNIRHKEATLRAYDHVRNAARILRSGMPPDMLFLDVDGAIAALGEIDGTSVSEEIIDRIFRDFCVGK